MKNIRHLIFVSGLCFWLCGCVSLKIGHGTHYHYHAAPGETLDELKADEAKMTFKILRLHNIMSEDFQDIAKEWKNM